MKHNQQRHHQHRGSRHSQKPQNRKYEKLVGKLENINISGFKSLKEIDFPLKDINVLVGANGVGKSNFLGFFEMLSWMIKGKNLQEYIAIKGGADDLLFNGAKVTRSIECATVFRAKTGTTDYTFNLDYTENNSLVFTREEYRFNASNRQGKAHWNRLGIGHTEAKITDKKTQDKSAQILHKMLQNCTIYQFHDTSDTSPLKQNSRLDDNVFLKSDGHNLPAILYNLQENEPSVYQKIIEIIKVVLPNFGEFELEPLYNKLTLKWRQKDNHNKIFSAHLTSDGTLRFIALVTLLFMPKERSSDIILLDEPELGLHPYAIAILAELIKSLAKTKQIIIATQSNLLVDEFQPEDIVVTESKEGNITKLKRLNKRDLKNWLEDYAVGELWQKNVFGGNPK